MPTFDVVVPCYNYGRFLERCVSSVLTQEGVDVRVLIIDDCSSDDSALVGERLAAADPRVTFRRHAVNKGHIATYNEGLLEWAEADYSLLLSADDAVVPGAFARAQRVFEMGSDVGFVFGTAKITRHDEEFRFPDGNDFASTRVIPGEDFLKYCCVNLINPVATSTAIVRTTLQKRLGGYRPDLPHSGDTEMWMRFALSGSVGIVRSVQGEYRQHGDNMSQSYYARVLSDRREHALTCRTALEAIVVTNPYARQWLDTMHAQLNALAEQSAVAAFEEGDIEKYRAWASFAREMSEHLERPRWSHRLLIRDALGPSVWRALRATARALGRPAQQPYSPQVAFAPAHGELIGWWPE